ncbi:hypothetical protein Zmor_004716 [Zophobas morio]|uniref:Uncharacterized protein n=1 Tax=Zophobas morio TaxID=2755281 RepID=A0AA38MJT4_9CUCU|nr:hypothetical protein Zmor_004716 [Zophobas morio]
MVEVIFGSERSNNLIREKMNALNVMLSGWDGDRFGGGGKKLVDLISSTLTKFKDRGLAIQGTDLRRRRFVVITGWNSASSNINHSCCVASVTHVFVYC